MSDLNTQLMQSMLQILQKQELTMKGMVDYSKKLDGSLKERGKFEESSVNNSEKIFKNTQKINEHTKSSVKETKNLNDGLSKAAGTMGSIVKHTASMLKNLAGMAAAWQIGDVVVDAFKFDQQMRDLSFHMGQGGKTAAELTQNIYDVSFATGRTTEEARDMIKTLTEARVAAKDVGQLATDTLRFAEITGTSNEVVGELAANLMRMGNVSAKQSANIMADMMKAQRAYGLAGKEMNNLTHGIAESVKVLQQFGKTPQQMQAFTSGTMKLASAFKSVGLNAEDATELVNRLLDPDKIEDNALLYAKLGYSISDAINGNIDPNEMQGKLQAVGQQIKGMSVMAGNALAKQMGMTRSQLLQMANMNDASLNKTIQASVNGSKEMADAQKDQEGPARQVEHSFNRLKATLGDILNKFLPAFQPFFDFLTKNADVILGKIKSWFDSKGMENFIGTVTNVVKSVMSALQPVANFIAGLFNNPLMIVGIIGGIILLGKLFKSSFKSIFTEGGEEFSKRIKYASISTEPEIKKSISRAVANGVSEGALEASKGSLNSSWMDKFKPKQSKLTMVDANANKDIYERIQLYKDVQTISTSAIKKQTELSREARKEFSTDAQSVISNMDGLDDKSVSNLKNLFNTRRVLSKQEIEERLKDVKVFNEKTNKLEQASGKEIGYLTKLASKQSDFNKEYKYQQELLIKQKELAAKREEIDFNRLSGQKLSQMKKELIESTKTREEELSGHRKMLEAQIQEKNMAEAQMKVWEDQLNIQKKNASVYTDAVSQQYSKIAELEKELAKDINDEQKKAIEDQIKFIKEKQTVEINGQKMTLGEIQQQVIALDEKNKEFEKGFITARDRAAIATAAFEQTNATVKELTNEQNKELEVLAKVENQNKKISKYEYDRLSVLGRMKIATAGVWNSAVTGVTQFARDLKDKVSENIGKIVHNVKNIAHSFRTNPFGTMINGAKNLLGGLTRIFKKNEEITDEMKKQAKLAKEQERDSRRSRGGVGKAALIGGAAIGAIGLIGGLMGKSEEGTKLMESLQKAFVPMIDLITKAFIPIVNMLIPIMTSLVDALSGPLQKVIDALVPILMGVIKAIVPILETVISVIEPIFNALAPILDTLMKALMPIFKIIGDTMKMIGPLLVEVIKAVSPLVEVLIDVIAPILNLAFKMVGPIIKLVAQLLVSLMPLITGLVKLLLPPILKVLGFLLKVLGTLISVIGTVIKTLTFGAISGIEELGKSIADAGDQMIVAADEIGVAAKEIGKNKYAELIANGSSKQETTKILGEDTKNNFLKDLSKIMGQSVEATKKMSMNDIISNKELANKQEELQSAIIKNTAELNRNNEQMLKAMMKKDLEEKMEKKKAEVFSSSAVDSKKLGQQLHDAFNKDVWTENVVSGLDRANEDKLLGLIAKELKKQGGTLSVDQVKAIVNSSGFGRWDDSANVGKLQQFMSNINGVISQKVQDKTFVDVMTSGTRLTQTDLNSPNTDSDLSAVYNKAGAAIIAALNNGGIEAAMAAAAPVLEEQSKEMTKKMLAEASLKSGLDLSASTGTKAYTKTIGDFLKDFVSADAETQKKYLTDQKLKDIIMKAFGGLDKLGVDQVSGAGTSGGDSSGSTERTSENEGPTLLAAAGGQYIVQDAKTPGEEQSALLRETKEITQKQLEATLEANALAEKELARRKENDDKYFKLLQEAIAKGASAEDLARIKRE